MRSLFVLFLFALPLINSLYGQETLEELNKAKKQINTYDDVFFKFPASTFSSIEKIPSFISIDFIRNDTIYAYVHKKNFNRLLSLNIPFKVVSKGADTKALTMATTVSEMANWDRYPTYSVYLQMMQNYATNYPSLCKLDTIGTTQEGRLLLVLKISDNPNIHENEPSVFLSGQMHGDELVGGVLFLRLIDYLLTNYNTSQRIRDLVDNVEIWINPLANPDGTYHGGNNTVANATRYYSNGVDPNRNFPNPVQGQHPDGESWTIETIAMMNFGNEHEFTMSMNTHSGAEVVNYPWDSWTSSQKTHADDNWWQYVSHEYADTVFLYAPSGYMTGVSSNGIIEGADWYYAYGSRQDYFTYYCHHREVTLELSNTKLLDAAQLPNHWNYNYRSFLNYIRQARYGIHGLITDACTGQPLKAKVFINNHDRDSSHVYSNSTVGDYHRPIYAGTYSITYSAPGYQSTTLNNVSVTNKTTVIKNVSLTPLPPVADFAADHTTGCNATIQFTNLSQYPVGSTFLWDFGDGTYSTLENPTHTYTANGNYTVTLTVQNSCSGNDTETKTNYINITLPDAPIVSNQSVCGPSNITLTATTTGTAVWYNQPQGGSPIATGNTYQTNVTQTTTFYVENHVTSSIFGGDTRSSSNGSFYTFSTKHYLIFDCHQACKLVSVEVNAQSSGNRTIELQDANGNVLQSATIYINAGISRITLNFDLPVANNLRLVGPASPGLYRNSSGSSYPYNIGNYVTITGNSANNLSYYYYFYNWEIQGPPCISPRLPVTVTVNLPPDINAGNDIQISPNTSTQLFVSVSGGSGNYSYQWEPSNLLNNSTIQDPTTIPLQNNQTFSVTVTDVNTGCTATDQVNVYVTSNVLTVNILPSENYVCSGQPVTLTTSVTGGNGNYTYQWSSNPAGFSSTEENPTVYPTSTTTYMVTVSDGNIQGTASVTINILPLPQASFNFVINENNVDFQNNSSNAQSVYWSFGDGTFSNTFNPTHTYTQNGDYTVTLIVTNNCGSDTMTQTIHIEPSIIYPNNLSNIQITPNPFQNIIYLHFDKISYRTITLYSLDGKIVFNTNTTEQLFIIDATLLESGPYIININDNKEQYRQLIVKTK